MALTARILASIVATQTSSDADTPGSVNPSTSYDRQISNGTAAPNQADLIYSATRQLGAASSETLDLAGGLTDAFGNAITFVEVVAILIVNLNTLVADFLNVGPNSSNGFGVGFWAAVAHRNRIAGAAAIELVNPDGVAVTAGTGDLLFVENPGANPVNYEITIVGRSA